MQLDIKQIPVEDIDKDFRKYKISRNIPPANLCDSIKKYGVLNPVYLLKSGKMLNPVFGLNRITCADICGNKTVPAFVDESIDKSYFINQSVMKLYNNEIGPCGKIKLIKILYDDFNLSGDEILEICRDFSVPVNMSEKETVLKFLSLPDQLLDYIDEREVQFKIIEKILKLENSVMEKLSCWAFDTKMKLNIFKSIVDMLFDLQKSGLNITELMKINPENRDDKNIAENEIQDSIFKMRYPGYSAMIEKSERIRNSLAGNKIITEIPKYFDGGSFNIRIPVDKRSGYAGLKKKIDSIKPDEIQEILDLL